jgi:hypothetical protein
MHDKMRGHSDVNWSSIIRIAINDKVEVICTNKKIDRYLALKSLNGVR